MPRMAPLTIRDELIPQLMPSANMICAVPLPSNDMTVIRMSSDGNAIHASTNRWMIRSVLPPKYPAAIPISRATSTATAVPARPIVIDTRAP